MYYKTLLLLPLLPLLPAAATAPVHTARSGLHRRCAASAARTMASGRAYSDLRENMSATVRP
jgi:hypothetical protein